MASLERVICDVCPRERVDLVKGVAAELVTVFQHFDISTPLRQAHFIAQASHETDGFRTLEEYASGKAYEGRKDLGNTQSGDGVRFKGHGIFQTTGRANHARVRAALKQLGFDVDCVKDPTLLEQPKWAAWAAGIFWSDHGLNVLADRDDCLGITRRINGGTNGLVQRRQYLQRAKEALTSGITSPEPMSRETVRAVQNRLLALNYAMVGQADGQIGPMTVAAVTAFQYDNGLQVTGQIDDQLVKVLQTAGPRPIPTSRANSIPSGSTILSNAKTVKGTAVGLLSVAGASLVQDPITTLTGVSQYVQTLKNMLTQMGIFDLPYLSLGTIVVGAGLYFAAKQIEAARVADHQSGKTA